jgi:cell division protein FtsB
MAGGKDIVTAKTKIILAAGGLALVAFLFVIGLGNRGAVDLYQLTLERDRLQMANHEIQEENEALYRTIERLKSDPGLIENIARTELGMTKRDEVVFLKKKK